MDTLDRRNPATRFVHLFVNIGRYLSLPQVSPSRAKSWFQIPPLGTIILILALFGFVVALEFIDNDVPGAQYWTSLGIRAGWLAVAQVPLQILIAGKNNLIGLVTGSSYERLNILHRWVARSILLMAILHFAFLNHSWIIYDVRNLEWSTDSCVPTGFATFGLLIWMNVSTVLPLRSFGYEFFVIQHLLTFFGFIIAIMFHLPSTALETRTYIWISIGLYLFDRLFRLGRSLWNDSVGTQATLMPIGDATKVFVQETRLRNWSPGSFVLLSIAGFNSLQSHPVTIISTPTSHDGNLIFLLKAHKGFTRKIQTAPDKVQAGSDAVSGSEQDEENTQPLEIYRAYIDGPYGGTQRNFAMFDTALLIAGSTGITFIMSILLDLASRVSRETIPLRRLEIMWAIKHRHQIEWVAEEFQTVLERLEQAGIELRLMIHVTQDRDLCDDETEQDSKTDTQIHASNLMLPCTGFASRRPRIESIITKLSSQSRSEMGVAVCGPLSMSCDVRCAVAKRCLTSQYGIYLHVEGFGW